MNTNANKAHQPEIIKMNSVGNNPLVLKKVTIYGERCSGTNYLEHLLTTNFDVEIIWDYGWKHFFGFHDLSGADDVLFIGIVRNLPDWINSLYRDPHHLSYHLRGNVNSFLNNIFFSINEDGTIMDNDRNIETNEIYNNIFELRHVKNKFLVKTMPTRVKNYKLITYDNLMSDFVNVMNQIKECGLIAKQCFPKNVVKYKGGNTSDIFVKKPNLIPDEIINNKANLYYEMILFWREKKTIAKVSLTIPEDNNRRSLNETRAETEQTAGSLVKSIDTNRWILSKTGAETTETVGSLVKSIDTNRWILSKN